MEIYQTLKQIGREVVFGLALGSVGACASTAGTVYHRPPEFPSSGGSGRSYDPGNFLPNPQADVLLSSPQDLEKALAETKECDLAHLDQFAEQNWEIFACEKKIGENRYESHWRINLTETCGVYIKEHYQKGFLKPFDWFTNDEVVISDSIGQVYRIQLGDETARATANVLALYAEQNRKKKKEKCHAADAYVQGNYALARPLTNQEKREAKQLLALRRGEGKGKEFASRGKMGSQAESSSGSIVYKDEKGNIIQQGRTVVLLER